MFSNWLTNSVPSLGTLSTITTGLSATEHSGGGAVATNLTSSSSTSSSSSSSSSSTNANRNNNDITTTNGLMSTTPPDVILEVGPTTTGSVRFVAHSLILGMHSGYLRSAIRLDETAAATAAISTLGTRSPLAAATTTATATTSPPSDIILFLTNVTADQFAPLLTYMYTGYLDLNVENIFAVLLATHVLHMPRALEICRSFLARIQSEGYLTTANASNNAALPLQSSGSNVKIIRPIPSKATTPNMGFITAPMAHHHPHPHPHPHHHPHPHPHHVCLLPSVAAAAAAASTTIPFKSLTQLPFSQSHHPHSPHNPHNPHHPHYQHNPNHHHHHNNNNKNPDDTSEEIEVVRSCSVAMPPTDNVGYANGTVGTADNNNNNNNNDNDDDDDGDEEVFVESNSNDTDSAGEASEASGSTSTSTLQRLPAAAATSPSEGNRKRLHRAISDENVKLTSKRKRRQQQQQQQYQQQHSSSRMKRNKIHSKTFHIEMTKSRDGSTTAMAAAVAATAPVSSSENKFIVDVASCDGPIRFRRILNDAYGGGHNNNNNNKSDLIQFHSIAATAATAAATTERTQKSLSLSFHQQMARTISQQQRQMQSEESENSECGGGGGGGGVAARGNSVPKNSTNSSSSSSSSSSKTNAAGSGVPEIFICVYCKHTFKSQYCYQKHAKRHLNPLSLTCEATSAVGAKCAATVDKSRDGNGNGNGNGNKNAAITNLNLRRSGVGCDQQQEQHHQLTTSNNLSATASSPPPPPPPLVPSPAEQQQQLLLRREVRPLDMNVQYYPCKTCGSKFPSYYFVHKHRKLCHANEDEMSSSSATDVMSMTASIANNLDTKSEK